MIKRSGMSKWVPISLWMMVAVLGVWVVLKRNAQLAETGDSSNPVQDGRVFTEVPWQHLPNVGDIRLKDQDGADFSSAAKMGTPFLVNFFFSTCPTICRQFNGKMSDLSQEFADTDLELLSITVDPETDNPALLKKYAESFSADTDHWKFLTGQPYQISQLGSMTFHVTIDKNVHTEKIILVDRWGKIRDWFDWNRPEEIQRLREAVEKVLAETQPPLDAIVNTRYALAGKLADQWEVPGAWLKEFKLTDSDGQTFYSNDLGGKVWLASFFFSTCPGICQKQNQHLAMYQERLLQKDIPLISITTDPTTDTAAVLREYARQWVTTDVDWRFLTGPQRLIEKIGGEFFSAATGGEHHSSRVYVIDKWSNVRGDFDWQKPEQERQMWDLIERLQNEATPPDELTKVRGGESE